MASSSGSHMRTIRIALWALVAVAGIAAAALYLYRPVQPQAQAQAGEPFYARPFQLVNQDGAAVTEADFLGKPSAWFFGFTYCPDICPTALAEMSSILTALGPDAEKLNVIFVSVDPERDTPEVLKDYVDYFNSRIIGLTGETERINAMAKDRYIYFEKVPMEGGDYTMEHQASVQLVDANGQFFGTLASEESFETRLAKVRRLIGDV